MAKIHDRYNDNIPGPFFVDIECIACDTCTIMAKNHFKLTTDFDHAIVYFQPQNAEEVQRCKDALDACPVDAIGVCYE